MYKLMVKSVVMSLLLGGVLASAYAEGQKIAYVDMQKAITETSAGKMAKKNLEGEFKKKQKEFKKKEEDLKKMSQDLEKKSAVLSDEVKMQKQQSLQKEMLKYRDQVTKSQLEIQKKERELTLPIVKKLSELLAKIAKEKGYSMVLEKSEQGVMWAQKDLDLTDDLVKEFEKKSKKK